MLVMTGMPFAFANNAFTYDFNKTMRPDYDIPGEHICYSVIRHFTQAIASLAVQGAQQHQNIRYDTDRLRAANLLDEEFEAVRTGLRKRVQDEYNITVSVDGWDDARLEEFCMQKIMIRCVTL